MGVMKPGFLLAAILVFGGASIPTFAETRLQSAMLAYVRCMNDLARRYDDRHSDVDAVASRFEDGCSAELNEKVDAEVAQNPAFASARDLIEQDNLNERHHAARMAVIIERAERH